MPRTVTLRFADFWPTFDPNDNIFINSLRAKYDVALITADDPTTRADILIYSRNGHDHYRYDDRIKVYYTGENDVPDFNECDYAVSFHDIGFGGRHFRYPIYLLYEYDQALRPTGIGDEEAIGRGFCSVVMRNHANCDPKRLAIVDAVEAYKPIAYGGPWRNNVGGPVEEKIPFIANYKFNLALENSVVDGYVTEKILEAFAARTVPLYFGTDDAARDFNPASYVNVNDFATLDSFVEHVKALDNDPKEYLRLLKTPGLLRDTKVDFDAGLADFLWSIARDMRRFTTPYGEMGRLQRSAAAMKPLSDSRLMRKLAKALQKFI